MLAWSRSDAFGEERQADAHHLSVGTLLGLLGAELVVARDPHRFLQGTWIVARVVLPTGRCRVWKLLGAEQVLHAQFGGIHLEFVRKAIDHALHQIHRFGDAERARVSDATRGLVRVHGSDFAVRGRVVVRASEDVEEPGRELARLSDAVECAVVRQHVDAQAHDLAVLRGRNFAVHVVVPGEAGGHQVLRAVLHPLHGLAGEDRANNRAHITGVDGHLVPEATADIW